MRRIITENVDEEIEVNHKNQPIKDNNYILIENNGKPQLDLSSESESYTENNCKPDF